MTDTPETLQSALADLTRRVAAFEKAQKQADAEPDHLTKYDLDHLAGGSALTYIQNKAYARLVHLESAYADAQDELARLREGLKRQPEDHEDYAVAVWASEPFPNGRMAREVQRHRALVTK